MGKKGRPKKDSKRSGKCSLRLSEEELNMLGYLSASADLSASEALRKGLKIVYNLQKARE